MKNSNMFKKFDTKKITLLAMFIAISYIFTLIAHLLPISLIPSVEFLKYDPKDIIICISGFILGPIEAFIITVASSFIEMITIGTTGFYGLLMNIIATSAFTIPASIIYKKIRKIEGAFLSLFVGLVFVIVAMILWNIIITPVYYSMDREIVIKNMLFPITLFNLFKYGLNIAAILVLYKPVVSSLRSIKLVERTDNETNLKTTLAIICLGASLLITLILIAILIKG